VSAAVAAKIHNGLTLSRSRVGEPPYKGQSIRRVIFSGCVQIGLGHGYRLDRLRYGLR
jgi:hypothetical protein